VHTIGWNFPAREPPTHMGTRPPPRPTHPPIGEGRTPSSPGSSMNDCTSGHGRGYLEELVADPIIRHGQFSQKDGKIANRGAPVVAIRRVSVFPGHWRILTHTPLGEQGWELHLAGEGRDKLALRRETIRLGIDQSVRYLGFVDELPARMQPASIVLAADRDSFGLSVVEAMATALPVVAARGGGHLETVGAPVTSDFLYDPTDTEAGGAALRRLALDPIERQIYGSALRSSYQDICTVERHARSLIEVYRRVLNG